MSNELQRLIYIYIDHKQQSPQPQVDEEETVQGETNVTESNDGTKTLDSEVQNQANNGK